MYLHFEDWSWPTLVETLDAKGLPHDGTIIKAFATHEDPRQAFGEPRLAVMESSETPFEAHEVYRYESRGVYFGHTLEEKLAGFGLNDEGTHAVRSLFRFSNEHGFCQSAMEAVNDEGWLIDHPFEDLDGIEIAARNPKRTYGIHLDIFFPESIARLREIIDINDERSVLDGVEASKRRLRKA